MASEEEWEDEWRPAANKSKKRRRSSSRKKEAIISMTSSSEEEENESDFANTNNKKRRRSLRSNTKKSYINTKDFDLSDSMDSDQESSKEKETTKNNKKISLSIESDDESDEIEIISNKPPKSKKNKKRKSEQTISEKEPPTKKRKVSASNSNLKGREATKRILEFMINANRPHSKNSLKNELTNCKISVGQIEKSLIELAENESLCMKEFGKKTKTKIFWANQENCENEVGEDTLCRLREIESEIKQKKDILNELKAKNNALSKQMTDSSLNAEMNRLVQIKKKFDAKLAELEGSNATTVSQSEIEEQLMEFYKYAKVWKERRAVLMDMIGKIWQDSKEKPQNILTKTVCGETDKENGVSWDQYKEIYKESCRVMQQNRDRKRSKR